MQNVYSECTCCYRPLSDDEIKTNKEKDNVYYTICFDCLEKYTNQIIEIAMEE